MRRVIVGNRSGSYGLRVSKPGYDAINYDVAGTLFDSDYRMMHAVGYFTIDFTNGGTNAPAAINHGLGYRPSILVAFTDRDTGNTWDAINYYGILVTSTQISAARNIPTGAVAFRNVTIIIQACMEQVS